jgi:hypothetical protein
VESAAGAVQPISGVTRDAGHIDHFLIEVWSLISSNSNPSFRRAALRPIVELRITFHLRLPAD